MAEVGAGTSVWTVEGDKEKALGEDGEDLSDNEDGDDSTKESKTNLLQESTIHDMISQNRSKSEVFQSLFWTGKAHD